MTAIPPLRRRQAAPRLPLAPPPVQPASQPVDLFFNSNRPGPAPINTDLSGLSDMTRALGGLSQHLAFKQGREEAIQEKANADAEAVEEALARPGLDRKFIGPPEALGEEGLIPRAAIVDEWEPDVAQGVVRYPISEGGVLIGSEGMQDPRNEEHRAVRNKVAKATRERVVEFAYSPTGQQAITETAAVLRADDDGEALMQFHIRATTFDPDKGGGLGGPDISSEQVVQGVLAARRKVAPWLNKGDARANPLARAAYLQRFYAYAKRFQGKVERDYAQSAEIYYKTVGGPKRVRAALYSAMDQLGEAPLVALAEGTQGPQQQTLQVVQDRMTHNFRVALSNMAERMARESGMPPSVGPGGLPLGANEISIGWIDDALRAKQQELIRDEREDEFPEWAEDALNVLDGVNIGNTKAIDHATYQALLAKWTPVISRGGSGVGSTARSTRRDRQLAVATEPYLDQLQDLAASSPETVNERVIALRDSMLAAANTDEFYAGMRVKPGERPTIRNDLLKIFNDQAEGIRTSSRERTEANLQAVRRIAIQKGAEEAWQELRARRGLYDPTSDLYKQTLKDIDEIGDARTFLSDPIGPVASLSQELSDVTAELKGILGGGERSAPPNAVRDTLLQGLRDTDTALKQGIASFVAQQRRAGKNEGEISEALQDWTTTKGAALVAPVRERVKQFRKLQEDARVTIAETRRRGMAFLPAVSQLNAVLGAEQVSLLRNELAEVNGFATRLRGFSAVERSAREDIALLANQAVLANDNFRQEAIRVAQSKAYGGLESPVERQLVKIYTTRYLETVRGEIKRQMREGSDDPQGDLLRVSNEAMADAKSKMLGANETVFDDALARGVPASQLLEVLGTQSEQFRFATEDFIPALKNGDARSLSARTFGGDPGTDGTVTLLTNVPKSLRVQYAQWIGASREPSLIGGLPTLGGGVEPGASAHDDIGVRLMERATTLAKAVPSGPDRDQAVYDIWRFSGQSIRFDKVLSGKASLGGVSIDTKKIDHEPYTTRYFDVEGQLENLIRDREKFGEFLKIVGVKHSLRLRPDGELQFPIQPNAKNAGQPALAAWIEAQKEHLRASQ